MGRTPKLYILSVGTAALGFGRRRPFEAALLSVSRGHRAQVGAFTVKDELMTEPGRSILP